MFKKLKLLLETKENLELMNKELINMNFEYEKKIKFLEDEIEKNNTLNKIKDDIIIGLNERISKLEEKLETKKVKKKEPKKEEIKEEPKKKGRKKKDV